MAGLINLLVLLLYLYSWLIIIRAVVSWTRPDPGNPLIQLLVKITEPILKPLRALVPPSKLGGIDLSPILAIVVIQIIRYLLLSTLF
jgi:YggT family protein